MKALHCPNLIKTFLIGAIITASQDVRGLVFLNSGPTDQYTAAPTGSLANAGWQYQGYFGDYLGTMISPHHFLTTSLIGVASNQFVHAQVFNGSSDASYTINTSVNGGLGFWDVPNTKMRIYEVDQTFPYFAERHSFSNQPYSFEVGFPVLMVGRGDLRGDPLLIDGEMKGWRHSPSDGRVRWGTDIIGGEFRASPWVSELSLFTTLDGMWPSWESALSPFEAAMASNDLGGGVFVRIGGVWRLAGVAYGGAFLFDTNNTPGDGTEFDASLVDYGGLYAGNDANGWFYTPDGNDPFPDYSRLSRVALHESMIDSIIGVPEPSSGCFVMIFGVCWLEHFK